MRSRMSLLLGVLMLGVLGMDSPAPASYETPSFNLERTVIRGYVESVQNQVAYVQTDDGDEIAVELGPESYWSRRHYYLPEGEYVTMEAWYDPTDRYTDWYFAGEIWGPDFDFVLTNDEGVPYWVLYRDDYYYSLGYRASCVSYMYWYDCPPVYFVYLILPPPPPRTYVCYYGPHWRNHHSDWNYGPRYGSGGSYWHDGEGHQRPGRRDHDLPAIDPRRDHGNNGSVSVNDPYRTMNPPAFPRVKPQPAPARKLETPRQKAQTPNRPFVSPQVSRRTAKRETVLQQRSQPQVRPAVPPMVNRVSTQKVVTPQQRYQPQTRPSVSPVVSRESAPRASMPPREMQTRATYQPIPPRPEASKSVVMRQAPREAGRAQVNPQPREPNEKRPVAARQGEERKQSTR